MEQAKDFVDESETLYELLAGVDASDWVRPTQFKAWTLNDILVHLHFWNEMAHQSLLAPEAFEARLNTVQASFRTEGMRATENAELSLRGPALRDAWHALYQEMGQYWANIDPRQRLKWAGPDMSARSSITARLMETWAHGQAAFDLLGRVRPADDRIRNVVVLGVNTFGWTYKVNNLAVPEVVPHLVLEAPSGTIWHFGDETSDNTISGSAVEFAQVVTQTRNIADTALGVGGPVATQWMSIAQCFAGGAETPPAVGMRYQQSALS
jgi:uncharacterized protein (TIGR03084 family)